MNSSISYRQLSVALPAVKDQIPQWYGICKFVSPFQWMLCGAVRELHNRQEIGWWQHWVNMRNSTMCWCCRRINKLRSKYLDAPKARAARDKNRKRMFHLHTSSTFSAPHFTHTMRKKPQCQTTVHVLTAAHHNQCHKNPYDKQPTTRNWINQTN